MRVELIRACVGLLLVAGGCGDAGGSGTPHRDSGPSGTPDGGDPWDEEEEEPYEDCYELNGVDDDGDGAIDCDDSDCDLAHTLCLRRWEQEAKLMADEPAIDDRMGFVVALDGDTAVAGAPDHVTGGLARGAAYVFALSGDTWVQQAKLVPDEGGQMYEHLGHAVAISEDSAIVGAWSRASGAGRPGGAAYVFVREGSSWIQQARLSTPPLDYVDELGWSVDIDGDTAVVGAPRDGEAATNAGAAYVFTRTGASWTLQQKLVLEGATTPEYFGKSVSISGTTILVGASAVHSYTGAAYVFVWDGSRWSQQARLAADDGDEQDYFGEAVAVSGDTAVIGARGDGAGNDDHGSAYVFTRVGVEWRQVSKLYALDAAGGHAFGYDVDIDGSAIAVGSRHAEAAYVYRWDGSSWTPEETRLVGEDTEEFDSFGYGVGISGDRVLVGAPTAYGGRRFAGAAYVFDLRLGQ